MAAPYKAVILAAGRGSRLGDVTLSTPKALLPIGPRSLADPTPTSFLRRQCELLALEGIADVVIVAGYCQDAVQAAVRSWGLDLRIVVNPSDPITHSGSLHSFQFAVRQEPTLLDGRHQTLLLDADIVYHRQALALLLAAPERTTALICRNHEDTGEEVLVWGSETRPAFIGKALSEELVGGHPCIGEATGIIKLAPKDHALANQMMRWLLGDPDAPEASVASRPHGSAGVSTEHEELTQWLARLDRLSCVSFGDELTFMEVDDASEYEHLRSVIYPQLLRAEAGQG